TASGIVQRMKTETLHRREIWSTWLRLSHWTLALSTLALMATGWLVHHTPSVAQAAADWHYIAGGIFTLGLALRIWVLFSDKLMGRWRFLLADLEPKKMLQMLKFYLSFGKSTLPRWYAHNPLWLPVYLMLFVLMILVAFTGHLQDAYPLIFGIYLPSLHAGVATLISLFVLGHVVAVFMHDLKGGTDDVSAMINGKRLFEVKPIPIQEISGVHKVSLDSLKSGQKKPAAPGARKNDQDDGNE
ncbi:cytochrome b/b6 domain-containing protein, partial [Thioalkalivibrio sp.]|uniref:cytochrome b/b6 domain-containing protein n=1 Tax=Thioalkalivibrio sp. TaxID=2093813 RepID=UPI003976D26E